VACFQLRNNAPSSASAAKATTNRKNGAEGEEGAVEFDRIRCLWYPTHKEVAACATVGISFGEVRSIQVNVEDHVGGVEVDGGFGMGGEVIEELFAFFHRMLSAF
jgi:hypothetical protein